MKTAKAHRKFAIYSIILVIASCLTAQAQHKADSSMQYRWPNSLRDTMQWPLTYGWYDTTRLEKGEGPLWIFDTVKRTVLVEDSAWIVIERYPPPPNCRCWGKYIFHEYLDADKHPYPKSALLETTAEIANKKDHH